MKPLLPVIACLMLFSCSNSSEEPADKDSDAPKFIPGIAAVDVYGNFEKQGFTVDKKLEGHQCTFTCDRVDGDKVYTVRALGKNPSSIDKVEATVVFPKKEEVVKQFIGYAASVPYTGSNPTAATQWATDHFNEGGDTTIGSVRFVLTARSSTARVLALYPH